MPEISVDNKGKKQIIAVAKGESLLQVLRSSGFEVYSPCGGNGTCGKCEVLIKGEGSVTSCLYPVVENIEIVLPDKREANILIEHQHTNTSPHQTPYS